MSLNFDDQVAVLRRCGRCGGAKTLTVSGQTSECDECDKNGRVIVGIDLRHFADYMGEEIAKIVRLRTGRR